MATDDQSPTDSEADSDAAAGESFYADRAAAVDALLACALEAEGAAVVYCEACGEHVSADETGLTCDHDRQAAPALRSSTFDSIFDEPEDADEPPASRVGRAKRWLRRVVSRGGTQEVDDGAA